MAVVYAVVFTDVFFDLWRRCSGNLSLQKKKTENRNEKKK